MSTSPAFRDRRDECDALDRLLTSVQAGQSLVLVLRGEAGVGKPAKGQARRLLSFGVPMLLGGDELGRTQGGNNNAYCQDNEISWFDWSAPDERLTGFTRDLIALRRAHPVFRRRRFLAGVQAHELRWYTPAGTEMTLDDWRDRGARCVALYLDGTDDPDLGSDGAPLVDDDFFLLVNAWWEPLDFTVPAARPGQSWRAVLDTYEPADVSTRDKVAGDDRVTVRPRSILVLQGRRPTTL